jgi:TPP-dependent pyruvate/acetoin dehydrogenase alpha subunit
MTEPEGTASLGVVPEVWLRVADVLSSMLLIRRFEERLISLYQDGKFAGHYHLSIGQEATATAVAAHRRDGDSLHTTHRNHGHLLACGADPGRMFAEIFGRESGYNHGRGGTLHLASAALGVPFTSAMVGGGVLHAVGAAYAAKKRKSGAVAIAFFGDGTFEEGALYEAFNLAALWQLPVLFVCENNGVSLSDRHAGDFPSAALAIRRLTLAPEAFGLPVVSVDGIDVDAVDQHVRRMLEPMRAGGGPAFIEVRTERWPGSRPIWPELPGGPWRTDWLTGIERPPAIAEWTRDADALQSFARAATARRLLSVGDVVAMDRQICTRIDAAVESALASPFPAAETATAYVFAGPATSI